MKFKRVIAPLLAAALVFSLAACGKKADDGLKPVTIGGALIKNLTANAGVAQSRGFFEEELAKIGYKPVYEAFAQAGPAINEAFATGNLDFAVYADFPQLVLRSNGVDIRAIAPVNTREQYAILVQPGSQAASFEDLYGKTVIVPKGTILQKLFEDFAALEGADTSKIRQLNAIADAQSVFSSGEAYGIVANSMPIQVLKAQYGGEILVSTLEHPELVTVYNLVGRGKFIDENPGVAEALVRALFRAWQYAAADPEKAYEALAFAFGPKEVMRAIYSFDAAFDSFQPVYTQADLAKMEETNGFLLREKLIAAKVELADFIDTQYIDAVKGEFVS